MCVCVCVLRIVIGKGSVLITVVVKPIFCNIKIEITTLLMGLEKRRKYF